MDTNGRAMETETQSKHEVSNVVDQGEMDDELEIIDDGSNPYKKVKVNVKGDSKKRTAAEADNSSDVKEIDADAFNKGEEESEALKNLAKEIRKKKKKSKKKERAEEDDIEVSGEKEKKRKSEKKDETKKSKHVDASEDKDDEKKEKKKKKKKKEREGEEKEKEKSKKSKKKKEGREESQDAKDKEKKKKRKKEKSIELYQKKFQEFEKKYPKYVQKGKIKFPIDDILFKLYDTILHEYVPRTKKPAPKNGLIPSGELGDILQIWNFYDSFMELFSFKNITQEEIYASLKYDREEHLYLIDYLHQEILIFFVKDFIKKNKFETFKDELENPFFVLVKYYTYYAGFLIPESKELALIWTELFRKIAATIPYSEHLTLTAKKYIQILAEATTLNYNKLEYKIKVKTLLELINLAYESEAFKDSLQEKMDQATGLSRERNELLAEIKQEEQEYYDLKAKIEVAEKQQKEEEEKWAQLSRTEVIKRQKDAENDRKELQKTVASLAKVEASLSRKRKRVEEINNSTNMTIDTAMRLGVDGNKSEYWIFTGQPERLYVKMSPLVYTEETWLYFDQKEEVDQLLEALNTKGIKEKSLAEKIKECLNTKHLDLSSAIEEPEPRDASKEEKDINYWYAKIQEYPVPAERKVIEESETGRIVTRQHAPEQPVVRVQEKRPHQLKHLTLDGVKEILETMEEHLTEYLQKWNARWAHPRIKEELKRKIKEATTVKEMTGLVLELEKQFQYSEAPLRQKTLEEQALAGEGEQEDEEDEEDDDDEDEEEEEKENGDEEENYYGEDDVKIKKLKRKGKNEDEEESHQDEDDDNEEGSDRERKKMEEEREKTADENKMEVEEEQKHKDDKEKQNGAEGPTEPQEKVKKMSLKIWGRVNEKIRRCWVAFTKDADNVTCLFLSASIFSEFVENYLEKKRAKYFTEFDTITAYMAAKRENKQNKASERAITKKQQNQQHSLEKLKHDRETRALNRNAAVVIQGKQRDNDSEVSDSPDRPIKKKNAPPKEVVEVQFSAKHNSARDPGQKRIRKLRDRSSEHSESDAEPDYNPKNDEKSRTKQEKLNELLNVRRSTRVTRRSAANEFNEENLYKDEEEDKECSVCGRGGELVECAMCESAYHLHCVRLKTMPEDKWTCVNCLQKLSSQRQTRSTTRKLH